MIKIVTNFIKINKNNAFLNWIKHDNEKVDLQLFILELVDFYNLLEISKRFNHVSNF